MLKLYHFEIAIVQNTIDILKNILFRLHEWNYYLQIW